MVGKFHVKVTEVVAPFSVENDSRFGGVKSDIKFKINTARVSPNK